MNKKMIFAGLLMLTAVVATAATATYRVRNGDTIKKVADKYGMTVEQLATLNPNAKLSSGQNVVVNVADPVPTPTPTPIPSGEVRMIAFVTAYTYWDNTPPGSADIALPVLHQKAGGIGTYADPITVAVGHSITNGVSTPDYPKGTKFYIPNLRRYFIVEDVCGDGSKPQNGPCHIGYPSNTSTWLDIWIDGQSGSKTASNNCAYAITDAHLAIKNPASNYVVVSGSVFQNGSCSTQYGDAVVTN